MDSKRNTISDLDRVLTELDGIFAFSPIAEQPEPAPGPSPGPFNGLPRPSLPQERRHSPRRSPERPQASPPPGQRQARPSAPAVLTSATPPPTRVYVRATGSVPDVPAAAKPPARAQSLKRQSEHYDYVIEEMDRHFSRHLPSPEGDYEDMDNEDAVFGDYVNIGNVTPPPPAGPTRLPDVPPKPEPLPRLSLDDRSTWPEGTPPQNLAMLRLKAQTEPRRRTDPCIANDQEKNAFLREASRKMSEQSTMRKAIVNVFNEDKSYRTIVVDEGMSARDVCELLIMKNRVSRRLTWQLFECLQEDRLERAIEDHENVLCIFESWPAGRDCSFSFRNNSNKYEFFQNPQDFVPDHLVEKREKEKSSRRIREKATEAREAMVREIAFTTSRFLEMEGLLWIKEAGAKWKQAFSFIRTSGLYYSTKGSSKEPKYLHCLVDFSEVNIYSCFDVVALKKVFKAPTDFLLVFKRVDQVEEPRDMVCISTRNEKNWKCFELCARISKFGIDCLRENFNNAVTKHEKMRQLRAGEEMKKKKKKLEDSIEQALSSLCNEDWYYGEMSREAASENVMKDTDDGVFLVRSTNGEIYLTMYNEGKIYHFLIQAMEVELCPRFTLEEGLRNFGTLPSLIEHYKTDSGSLPRVLTHPPSRKITRYIK